MKKAPGKARRMRKEYDFSKLRGGVRGKYYKRYSAGTNLVLLQPDVARAFPNEDAVNEALRGLMKVASRSARPRKKATRS